MRRRVLRGLRMSSGHLILRSARWSAVVRKVREKERERERDRPLSSFIVIEIVRRGV